MIYVLIQEPSYSDEDPKMIFASHHLSVVEQKYDKIKSKNTLMQRVALSWKAEADEFQQSLPPLIRRESQGLPPRPPVWVDNRWQNAYAVEDENKVRERNDLVQENNKKIFKKLSEFYSMPVQDLENIWTYLDTRYYSVKEVESD